MTPMGRSPSVRYSVVPDSSRRAKHENAIKVQEVLQLDDHFYAELGLQNGLKSMTSKQFLQIINFFVKSITGKEMAATFGKGDPLDGIINFLRDLGCPFMINKSMLRTPNAPHTFDQIVVLMMWLSEFIIIPRTVADIGGMTNEEFKRDDELPDREYTAKFSQAMKKGFQLWNSESDEFATLQNQLVDDFIRAKTKEKVSTAADLQILAEKLHLKNRDLEKMQIAMPNEHDFQRIKNEHNKYESSKKELKAKLKEIHQSFNAVNVIWKTKNTEFQQKQKILRSMEQQIATQCVSIYDFKKLASEIASMKSSMSSVQQEVQSLQAEETIVSTNRARLMKKVSDAIPIFNKHSKRIIEIVQQSHLNVDEHLMNDLFLKPNPTLKQIEQINKKLNSIASLVNIHKHDITIKMKNTKDRLELLNGKEKNLAKEYQKLVDKKDSVSSTKLMLETKIENKTRKFKNVIDAETVKLQKATADHEDLIKRIAEFEEQIKKFEEDNLKIMITGEKKLMEIATEKKRMLDAITKLDDEVMEMLAIAQQRLSPDTN